MGKFDEQPWGIPASGVTVAVHNDLDGLSELVDRLRGGDRRLLGEVVDAMTVNETSFFRDPRVWEELGHRLLPELLSDRQVLRRLDVWCAASSSGQEIYSLLMLLAELLGSEFSGWRINLVATDISPTMVERTAAGVYSELEVGRGLSVDRRNRFFRRDGIHWVADDELRSRVRARRLNLTAGEIRLSGSFDLVLLRNVLIYFDSATRSDVLVQVTDKLTPTGRLVLGTAEGVMELPPDLTAFSYGTLMAYGLNDPESRAAARPVSTTLPSAAPSGLAPSDDGLTPVERLRALRAEYHRTFG